MRRMWEDKEAGLLAIAEDNTRHVAERVDAYIDLAVMYGWDDSKEMGRCLGHAKRLLQKWV